MKTNTQHSNLKAIPLQAKKSLTLMNLQPIFDC